MWMSCAVCRLFRSAWDKLKNVWVRGGYSYGSHYRPIGLTVQRNPYFWELLPQCSDSQILHDVDT